MAPSVLFCTDTLWDERGDELRSIDPDIDVVRLVGNDQVTPDDLARITAAFFSPDAWPDRASSFLGACMRSDSLRWVQTFSAGTDHPVFAGLRDKGIQVTNASGASAPSIAQTVMMYLLALSRDLPRLGRAQAAQLWEPGSARDLTDVRLGIIGLGAIGGEVARVARAFDMEVIGLRRTVRGDEPCTAWTDDRLDELLGWADAIAVTAPLTDATRGLIDAGALATMRPGGWLVNVGRGEIVDEVALVDALESSHLGGAGLDVFATEPLPAESPLWECPNVIITPHSSGTTDRSHRRAVDLFVENFRRLTDGEPLRNVTSDELAV